MYNENMFNKIISYFSGVNKIYFYIVGAVVVLTIFLFSYKAVISQYEKNYKNGYDSGVLFEKNRLNEEYKLVIEEKIKENTNRLNKEFSIILQSEKNKEKNKIAYIKRLEEANIVMEKSINLNKKECSLTDFEVEFFNKATRGIK